MGEKKTNALSKSMKLIYVYAMATGAIFTFMCYWDGIFMSYTGPGTFLAFALYDTGSTANSICVC